jgi:hypothetical protein
MIFEQTVPSSIPGSHRVDYKLGPADVPGTSSDWSVTKTTLQSGASAGVEMWIIDNGRIKISVVATRGMGIWAVEAGDERLGWKSPVRGPIHPQYVPLMEPPGMGWLEGFDELMVRCGLESNGSPVFDDQGRLRYPLHGRIASRPAHSLRVEIDPSAGTIALHAVVDEIRFHFQKLQLATTLTTKFGSTEFGWHDRVTNFSAAPAKLQMLYHINVGEPLLDSGSKFVAPVLEASPHDRYADDPALHDYRIYPAARAANSQQSFFFELLADDRGDTRVLLENAAGKRGLSIKFNKQELPWFTQWRNNVDSADGYVTGLEPGTNFPNPQPFEEKHGRVVQLAPGASWQCKVNLDWHLSESAVHSARSAVAKLQGDHSPLVQPVPTAKHSAKA